jgi:GTP-dependent phosphoenolpyruvate carboxykinase
LKEEQGRIIDRTFYIANRVRANQFSLANKHLRDDRHCVDVREKMGGIMEGMPPWSSGFMSAVPWVRQGEQSRAIEITSSAYVSHSAEILYRNIYARISEKEVSRKRALFTPIFTVKASTGPRIYPMHGFSWTGATVPRIRLQLHLCRQHPAAEKRQPSLFRGQSGE